MSAAQLERLQEHLQRRRLFKVRERLEALLQDAPAKETPSADFLDLVLTEEVASKTAKHVTMSAPGPFPLRQEPRDLRLQLAALSRAVSENRLDARLKIYTVPRLLIVDEICYLPIDRTSPRRLSPTNKYESGASPRCCQQ